MCALDQLTRVMRACALTVSSTLRSIAKACASPRLNQSGESAVAPTRARTRRTENAHASKPPAVRRAYALTNAGAAVHASAQTSTRCPNPRVNEILNKRAVHAVHAVFRPRAVEPRSPAKRPLRGDPGERSSSPSLHHRAIRGGERTLANASPGQFAALRTVAMPVPGVMERFEARDESHASTVVRVVGQPRRVIRSATEIREFFFHVESLGSSFSSHFRLLLPCPSSHRRFLR